MEILPVELDDWPFDWEDVDLAQSIVASQLVDLVQYPYEAICAHLEELREYGPWAYWYLLHHMRKRTSAEPERRDLVLRIRYLMITDSICGRRKHIRTRTLALDRFQCRNCAHRAWRSFSELAVDHILPRIRGGGDEQSNLQTLCRRCNSSKSAMTQEEWEKSGLAALRRLHRKIQAT